MFTLAGTDQKDRIGWHPGVLPLFSDYGAKQGQRK